MNSFKEEGKTSNKNIESLKCSIYKNLFQIIKDMFFPYCTFFWHIHEKITSLYSLKCDSVFMIFAKTLNKN